MWPQVHQEIDSVLGQTPPSYAQRSLLPYTTATLAEVQRIKPIAPLSVPHAASRDTTLNGYNIPQETWILVNLWSVHMDPKLFPEPNQFQPERFLDQDGNFVKHEALIPFGIGHRVCLGEQLAKMELFMLFLSLMQRFTFHLPEGAPEPSMLGSSAIFTALPVIWLARKPRVEVTKTSPIHPLEAPFFALIVQTKPGGLGITCAAVSVVFAVPGMANKRDDLDRNKGDIKKMESIPAFCIFTSTAVWAVVLLQVAPYFWDPLILPLYFSQSFGTKIELVGVLAGIPILIYGALEPLFALVENILCKHISTTVARKSMAVIGCLCVSGCLFVAAFTSNSVVAACFVAAAYGSHAAREVVANANIFDIAPRYASVISGISRGISRVVGLTFPLLVTAITKNKTLQEWSHVVLIKACVFAVTALIFGAFGSGQEQPWAAVPLQNQDGDGNKKSGSINGDVDNEKRPLVRK
ncbi:CYP2U1 [Branchiostoma lanceolatum]|uniref:CYP2U1 protein n=1 Tax=Branchiostoma lanceolatum TaxID=7740 RepID=A0A8J9ZFD3_BRALA|nr:CYP2U1 [Branchiostoma lanceolatum]